MEATVTRTDSGVTFRNAGGVELRGTIVRLSRDAIVFEVYSPYAVVEKGDSLPHLTILRDGRPVYSGGAIVESVLSTGVMLIITATPLGTWAALAEGDASADGWADTGSLVWDWEDTQQLLPDVQIAVTSMRSFLDRLSRWVTPMDLSGEISRDGGNERVERMFGAIQPRLMHMVERWEDAWQEVGPEQKALHRRFAQRELHPLMLCGPFIHRTFSKPLGYAGDYEMVNMLVRNTMEGPSTYAKLVNALVLRMDPGQAHRNRIARMVDYLVKEAGRVVPTGRPLRVLNLGCGPAHEVEQFIREHSISERCEFTLLDFNAETIEYTRKRLDEVKRQTDRDTPVKFLQMSINDLLREALRRGGTSAALGEYDFVYCAGLFDYMSDKVCSRLLQLLSTWTVPGGFLLSTNVHPRHRIHAMMEDVLEWHLILRTESDMLSLADEELGHRVVNTEATGVNVFLEIRKRE